MRTLHVAAAVVVAFFACAAAYPVYDPSEYGGKKWVHKEGDRVKHEFKYIGQRPWARPAAYGKPEPEIETKKSKVGKVRVKMPEKAKTGVPVEIEVHKEKVKKPSHRHEETEVPAVKQEPKTPVVPGFDEEYDYEVLPPTTVVPEPLEPPSTESPGYAPEEEPDQYTYSAELDYPEEISCAVAVPCTISVAIEEAAALASLGLYEYEIEEEYHEIHVIPVLPVKKEIPAEPSVVASVAAPSPSVVPSVAAPEPSEAPVEPEPAPVKEYPPKVYKKPQPSPKKPKYEPIPSPHYKPEKPVKVPPYHPEKKKEKVHKRPPVIVVEPPPRKEEVPPPVVKVVPPVKTKKEMKKKETCCCECGKKQPPGCYCYPTLPKRHFPTYYRPEYSPYIRPGAGYGVPTPEPKHAHKPSKHKREVEPEHEVGPLPHGHKKILPVASPVTVTHEPRLPHGKKEKIKKYVVEKKTTKPHPPVDVPEHVKVKIPSPSRIEIPSYHFPQKRYRASYPHHYYGPATRVKIHCGPDEYCKHGAKRKAKMKAYPYKIETKTEPKPSPVVVAHSTEEVVAVMKPKARVGKPLVHTTEKPEVSKKCRKCKKKCKGCEPCVEDEHGCAVEQLSTDQVLAHL